MCCCQLWGPNRCCVVEQAPIYCFVGGEDDLLLFSPACACECPQNVVSFRQLLCHFVSMDIERQEGVQRDPQDLGSRVGCFSAAELPPSSEGAKGQQQQLHAAITPQHGHNVFSSILSQMPSTSSSTVSSHC